MEITCYILYVKGIGWETKRNTDLSWKI